MEGGKLWCGDASPLRDLGGCIESKETWTGFNMWRYWSNPSWEPFEIRGWALVESFSNRTMIWNTHPSMPGSSSTNTSQSNSIGHLIALIWASLSMPGMSWSVILGKGLITRAMRTSYGGGCRGSGPIWGRSTKTGYMTVCLVMLRLWGLQEVDILSTSLLKFFQQL